MRSEGLCLVGMSCSAKDGDQNGRRYRLVAPGEQGKVSCLRREDLSKNTHGWEGVFAPRRSHLSPLSKKALFRFGHRHVCHSEFWEHPRASVLQIQVGAPTPLPPREQCSASCAQKLERVGSFDRGRADYYLIRLGRPKPV